MKNKIIILTSMLLLTTLVNAEELTSKIPTVEEYGQKWDEQDMIRSHKDNAWHKSEYRKLEKMYKKDLGSELYETYDDFNYVSSRLYDLEKVELLKDVDGDGKVAGAELALYKARESIYNTLPENRAYWQGTLEKIGAEEKEIYDMEKERMSIKDSTTNKLVKKRGTFVSSRGIYEYTPNLREGARGKWSNLEKHLTSEERLGKELDKVNKQIDRKVEEIKKIEKMLLEN